MSERTNVHNIAGLRQAIAELPDETPIITQVVDGSGGAWMMSLDVGMPPGFRWGVNPVCFTASHPDLKKLPTWATTPDAPPADVPAGAILADIDDEVPIDIALSTVDGLKTWMKRQAADVARLTAALREVQTAGGQNAYDHVDRIAEIVNRALAGQ